MTTIEPPSEPPASGPAVEQPPHREDDRPRTTVYPWGEHALWIYWPTSWQRASVRSKQHYRDGRIVYQVECWLEDGSRGSRSFAWGPDNVRVVTDE